MSTVVRLVLAALLTIVIPATDAACSTNGADPLQSENLSCDMPPSSSVAARALLQQAQSTANCTPPRTAADAQKPFCFVPDTISAEAQQFLSQAAAGKNPFGVVSVGNTPAEQAATVAGLREFYADIGGKLSKAAEAQYIQSTRNGSIAGVPVMFAVPKRVREGPPADTKVLLYLHGGGYAVGSCWHQLSVPAATAAGAGLTIICPEYRLAPEYLFPAGLNDVLTVYKALINQEGYMANNIVLLGDSAGGGMVPAVAVQLQREGVALPAALGMFSPWSDMHTRGDSSRTLIAVDPSFSGAVEGYTEMTGLAGVYLGGNASLMDDPLASPVLADYASIFPDGSLPPTLIQVGLRELLLSDSVRLYHRMRAAAPAPGHVALSPYEGMWHVFQMFTFIPEAAAASKEMADYFTRALNGQICK